MEESKNIEATDFSASVAAINDAMDKVEANFRLAKEDGERERRRLDKVVERLRKIQRSMEIERERTDKSIEAVKRVIACATREDISKESRDKRRLVQAERAVLVREQRRKLLERINRSEAVRARLEFEREQKEEIEAHEKAKTALDVEIKRWSTGKEGDLRLLLSTLQDVLWPECGWQPVPLTDLITYAHAEQSYWDARFCIHPNKLLEEGANLQQQYIGEKVAYLLKEARDKFKQHPIV